MVKEKLTDTTLHSKNYSHSKPVKQRYSRFTSNVPLCSPISPLTLCQPFFYPSAPQSVSGEKVFLISLKFVKIVQKKFLLVFLERKLGAFPL